LAYRYHSYFYLSIHVQFLQIILQIFKRSQFGLPHFPPALWFTSRSFPSHPSKVRSNHILPTHPSPTLSFLISATRSGLVYSSSSSRLILSLPHYFLNYWSVRLTPKFPCSIHLLRLLSFSVLDHVTHSWLTSWPKVWQFPQYASCCVSQTYGKVRLSVNTTQTGFAVNQFNMRLR
jgi:hypothetical protein